MEVADNRRYRDGTGLLTLAGSQDRQQDRAANPLFAYKLSPRTRMPEYRKVP